MWILTCWDVCCGPITLNQHKLSLANKDIMVSNIVPEMPHVTRAD